MSTISHWLGHASLETTHKYAKVDLDMKREAIRKVRPVDTKGKSPGARWRKDPSILTWLESL